MRSLRLAAAAAALTLVLAACGSSSSSASSTPSSSAPAGGSSSTPAVSGKKIAVTEKDFSITVANAANISPGTYTFVVTNQGPSSHDLTVNGPGVSNMATPSRVRGRRT